MNTEIEPEPSLAELMTIMAMDRDMRPKVSEDQWLATASENVQKARRRAMDKLGEQLLSVTHRTSAESSSVKRI